MVPTWFPMAGLPCRVSIGMLEPQQLPAHLRGQRAAVALDGRHAPHQLQGAEAVPQRGNAEEGHGAVLARD